MILMDSLPEVHTAKHNDKNDDLLSPISLSGFLDIRYQELISFSAILGAFIQLAFPLLYVQIWL